MLQACVVGGCANTSSHVEHIAWRDLDMEVRVCDYHWGWLDALPSGAGVPEVTGCTCPCDPRAYTQIAGE